MLPSRIVEREVQAVNMVNDAKFLCDHFSHLHACFNTQQSVRESTLAGTAHSPRLRVNNTNAVLFILRLALILNNFVLCLKSFLENSVVRKVDHVMDKKIDSSEFVANS